MYVREVTIKLSFLKRKPYQGIVVAFAFFIGATIVSCPTYDTLLHPYRLVKTESHRSTSKMWSTPESEDT